METRRERFALRVNGSEHALEVDGRRPLLDVLRNELGPNGTRFGCGTEQCGACFVLVDGHAVASCDTPLWAVSGKSVVRGVRVRDPPVAAERVRTALQ